MAAPQTILIRSVNWLGDAVMATPALLRLRERFPGAHITLLTPEKLRDLWHQHPAVNETITIAPGEGVFAVSRKLKNGKFDVALVLPNSPRSALEPWLAGIPQRIGYARPWRNWFLTQAVPTRPGHVRMHKRTPAEVQQLIAQPAPAPRVAPPVSAHQVHEYLQLVATLGANPEPVAPFLQFTASEAEPILQKFGLPPVAAEKRPIFGLNPGAEYGPAKRWPIDKFAAVARVIQDQLDCVWLLFGGKNDTPLTAAIAAAVGGSDATIRDLAGKTSLRELMALLKSCRVLLTNDTGPMHLAAALGTPVVVPFGSTSPELTGPGLPGDARHGLIQSDAVCSPCFLRECPIDFRCMRGIAEERVTKAVLTAGNL